MPVVTVYSTIEPFRLGPLGWTPAEQSAYSSVLAGANGLTTLFVAKPLIAAWGTRSVYELGSLAAAISYVGLSQSCRPGDASHMRKTIQFCICKIALMTPWSEPAFSAIGPMIIKQGMAVTDAGRGDGSTSRRTATKMTPASKPPRRRTRPRPPRKRPRTPTTGACRRRCGPWSSS